MFVQPVPSEPHGQTGFFVGHPQDPTWDVHLGKTFQSSQVGAGTISNRQDLIPVAGRMMENPRLPHPNWAAWSVDLPLDPRKGAPQAPYPAGVVAEWQTPAFGEFEAMEVP